VINTVVMPGRQNDVPRIGMQKLHFYCVPQTRIFPFQ